MKEDKRVKVLEGLLPFKYKGLLLLMLVKEEDVARAGRETERIYMNHYPSSISEIKRLVKDVSGIELKGETFEEIVEELKKHPKFVDIDHREGRRTRIGSVLVMSVERTRRKWRGEEKERFGYVEGLHPETLKRLGIPHKRVLRRPLP